MKRTLLGDNFAAWLATAALLLAPQPAVAQSGTGTLRVDGSTGIDSVSCGSVEAPCQNIQQAINNALDGEQLLVAAGTYTYQASLDQCTSGNSAVVCIVNKRLTILGGYASGSWDTSNPAEYQTTIDGQNSTRGVLVEETVNEEAGLTMNGITVTRGRGDPRTGSSDAFGGGLSAVAADPQKLPIILTDMVFSNNKVVGGDTASSTGGFGAGGALSLRNLDASSSLARITFSGNEAAGGSGSSRGGYAIGGAVYTFQSELNCTHLTFTDNLADAGATSGGGISNGLADAQGGGFAAQIGSTVTLQNITATNNRTQGGAATTDAGGGYGGAIFAEGENGRPTVLTLTDSVLRENTSLGGGGDNGGLGNGGAIMTTKWVALTLDRVQMINNTAQSGDGTVNRGSTGGGGAYVTGGPDVGSSSAAITNCAFANNRVQFGSGGGSKGGGGGGLFVQNLSSADVVHCTFAQNSLSASPLTGMAITLAGGAGPVTINVDYTIIADHTEHATAHAVFAAIGNTANLNTGLFAGNSTDSGGTGTVNTVAMLWAASAEFRSPGSPDFDYHLNLDSPAVSEAIGSTTALDIDGESRDENPDIGADEYTGAIFSDGFESGDLSKWSAASP